MDIHKLIKNFEKGRNARYRYYRGIDENLLE
jgi:hypothetical protein